VLAQRDLIVASYAVLGSIGRLSAQELNLDVAIYDPAMHYEQVKTKWFGVETPDGR
jgi:outer membrane protein